MTNAEKSDEFSAAIHYCRLVNEWHKTNVPDSNSEDPALTANCLLKLYELRWTTGKYEVVLKELV